MFDEASQEIRFGHALRGEFHKLSFRGRGYQTKYQSPFSDFTVDFTKIIEAVVN